MGPHSSLSIGNLSFKSKLLWPWVGVTYVARASPPECEPSRPPGRSARRRLSEVKSLATSHSSPLLILSSTSRSRGTNSRPRVGTSRPFRTKGAAVRLNRRQPVPISAPLARVPVPPRPNSLAVARGPLRHPAVSSPGAPVLSSTRPSQRPVTVDVMSLRAGVSPRTTPPRCPVYGSAIHSRPPLSRSLCRLS